MHVRRFFVHVNLCGNDVFRAYEVHQKRRAFLEKALGVLRCRLVKKRTVRGHDKAAHMHGVFPDRLDQQKVVNAILDYLGVVFRDVIAKLVVVPAPLVINIRVGMALALPLVVALNAADGLFFELVHVQDEK